MKRIDNPALDRLILTHLAERYGIYQKREGLHLSTLVYCLTRSFFDQQAPTLPTDEEVMLFATGYGLQEILTPKSATTPIFEKDGIIYRPDMVFPVTLKDIETLVEIKTTRAGVKRYLEGPLPETWIEYIAGGCYIKGTNSYELSVLYVAERPVPKIRSETLIFDEPGELESNWGYLLKRKEVYTKALADNTPPTPFNYCKEWECKSCRYLMMCEAIVQTQMKEEAK